MKKTLLFVAVAILLNSSSVFANTNYYDDTNRQYKGDELMQNKQYSGAIYEYKKVLRNDSQDVQARVGLINAYLKRATYYANEVNDYTKASTDIKSALFYLQYFVGQMNDEQTQNAIAQYKANLAKIQAQQNANLSVNDKYKIAKHLRTQGEFAAAAYDFIQIANASQTLRADSYIQIGDIMNILGVYNNAVYYYNEALNTNPKKDEVHLKLARVYDKMGKIDEAANEYTKAFECSDENSDILSSLENIWVIKVQNQPRSAEAHANLGAIYQKTERIDLALAEYQKAQSLDPSNVNIRLNLGTLYQQKKDYETAILAYDSILNIYPSNEKAILYKAQCQAKLGKHEEALENYKKYLELKPADTWVKTEMLTLLKDKMTPEEVLEILYQDVKDNPNNPDAYYKFAYELHKANKLDDAITYYDLAIKMNPKMADAYINLAQAYIQQNKNNLAIDTLKKGKAVIADNQKLNSYYNEITKSINDEIYNKATEIFSKGEYQLAINEYSKIQPPTVDSLVGIGSAYQSLENYPKAIEYFKKALAKEPKNTDIMYYIALAYSNKEDIANAKIYIQKAITLTQSDAKIKELNNYILDTEKSQKLDKAFSLYESAKYVEALTLLNTLIAQDSKNAHAYFYRGMVYDAQKKYNEAISSYLNSVKYSNELNVAYYSIGVDYDYLKNYTQAVNYYRKYLSTKPTEQEYVTFVTNRIKELTPYVNKK